MIRIVCHSTVAAAVAAGLYFVRGHDAILLLSLMAAACLSLLVYVPRRAGRKGIQDDAREEEAKYRTIVETAYEGIAVTQKEIVRYCNPALSEMSGYSWEEIHAHSFLEFIHPDERERVLREYTERISGEHPPHTYATRIVTKDGQVKHVLVHSAMIKWASHPAVLTTLTDITKERNLQDKLKQSEEVFRSLMEQSPLAVEILTPDGRITQINPAWRRMWSASENEAEKVLAKYNMLTDPQTADLGVAELIEKAFAGQPVILPPIQYSAQRTTEDFNLPKMDVRAPWIQCHLYPVKDPDGKIMYVVNTYMDITELKSAEKEVREKQEALARVDRATLMGQLTGSIAHELNQPLTGILSNAQAAELFIKRGAWTSHELGEILTEIVADTKRAGDVIRNLHDLYRKQKGDVAPVQIKDVVADTVKLLHSELVLQQIVLTQQIPPSIPVVDGNRIQLQQVLVNLTMNGIEAMRDVPHEDRDLLLGAEDAGDEVRVWIEDRGPGIDEDRIADIFEPLATFKSGGTGMGLALSHAIVQSYGGTMWAENLPPGGARVGFTLPVREEENGEW